MKNFFKEKWFAEKRDRRWLMLIAPIALVIWMLFAWISWLQLGVKTSGTDVFLWMLLAFIMSAVLGGFGYANLKIAFGFTAAGIFAGLGFMAYVFTRQVAYRGIVGLVSGVELTFIFFVIGINIQMLHHLMKGRRRYGR